MATMSIDINIDNETKAKAQEVFAGLGLDISTAVSLFLQQTASENRTPLCPTSLPKRKNRAKIGGWEGKINVPDNFNDPMEEFEGYM